MISHILENREIDERYFLLRTDAKVNVKPGQFFMLRAWEDYPTLSRPISVYNYGESLDFLIEKKGTGTNILKALKQSDVIKIYGPYGNSFDQDVDEVFLIGGGVGVAPMYFTAKEILKKNKDAKVSLYIGIDEITKLDIMFYDLEKIGVKIVVKRGGFITDAVDFEKAKLIYACGPEAMLENVAKLSKARGVDCYLSFDKKMACGVGACLGCTCKTKNGNKRTCKDGPIFKGSDIYE